MPPDVQPIGTIEGQLEYVDTFRPAYRLACTAAVRWLGLAAVAACLAEGFGARGSPPAWLAELPCGLQAALGPLSDLALWSARAHALGGFAAALATVGIALHFSRRGNRGDDEAWRPPPAWALVAVCAAKAAAPVLLAVATSQRLPPYLPEAALLSRACEITASRVFFPPGAAGLAAEEARQLRAAAAGYFAEPRNHRHPSAGGMEAALAGVTAAAGPLAEHAGCAAAAEPIYARSSERSAELGRYHAPNQAIVDFCAAAAEHEAAAALNALAALGASALPLGLRALVEQVDALAADAALAAALGLPLAPGAGAPLAPAVPDVAAALLGDAASNFTAGLLPTSWSDVREALSRTAAALPAATAAERLARLRLLRWSAAGWAARRTADAEHRALEADLGAADAAVAAAVKSASAAAAGNTSALLLALAADLNATAAAAAVPAAAAVQAGLAAALAAARGADAAAGGDCAADAAARPCDAAAGNALAGALLEANRTAWGAFVEDALLVPLALPGLDAALNDSMAELVAVGARAHVALAPALAARGALAKARAAAAVAVAWVSPHRLAGAPQVAAAEAAAMAAELRRARRLAGGAAAALAAGALVPLALAMGLGGVAGVLEYRGLVGLSEALTHPRDVEHAGRLTQFATGLAAMAAAGPLCALPVFVGVQGWPAAAGGASASQLGLAVALVAFLTSAVGGNCGWFARGFRAAVVLAVALCVAAWQTDARPDPADPAGAALLGVLLRFAFEYRLARLAACGAVARAAAAAFERHADVYYGQGERSTRSRLYVLDLWAAPPEQRTAPARTRRGSEQIVRAPKLSLREQMEAGRAAKAVDRGAGALEGRT